MGRKRKVPLVARGEEKENDAHAATSSVPNKQMHHGPMYTIVGNAQLSDISHKKYIREMQQLYAKMDHDAYVFTFIKVIKCAMAADEANEYAQTTLLFSASFISSYDGEETHPILIDVFKWLLTTISPSPHIRFRLCQFVNMILSALGQNAALDDTICDHILEYMLDRLRDVAPSVRVQAIQALQRLQVPDNPNDTVLKAYQFHLSSDPSARVRQAVITSMGRNYHTVPHILERLWDIDEKVRRHTYVHMSTFPVRSYKVSQRLTLLEQGLNDRSESVRKVITTIMLKQWIESYQGNIVSLISALKLDSNETELARFMKTAKQMLSEIFNLTNKKNLLASLTLQEDGEFYNCVKCEELTIEIALYWQCLTDYLHKEMADESDVIVPELTVFCAYVEKFCQFYHDDMDKFETLEFQSILLSLIEILLIYDLGDEIGRGNLQLLVGNLLKNINLDEKVIQVIVKCTEKLITDQTTRVQFFVEIIQDICALNVKQNDLLHDRNLINDIMAFSSDADLNLKLSSLKVVILDLEEQEMISVQKKEYMKAQQITERKLSATEEYTNLLKPLLEQYSKEKSLPLPVELHKAVKNETILKSLQMCFYMVSSPIVSSLTPSICDLYNDFICRHIASNQISIRDWALKCGAACSLLYETFAKDLFEVLYSQFFKNHNIRIWETSIAAIFELLDRYGVDYFVVKEEQNKSKKTGRQLYTTLEFVDVDDESGVTSAGQGVGVIYMMSHFLDTCDDICIIRAIIKGFCRLVLHDSIKNTEIVEKLLLRYFNPGSDPKINQILGVFIEELIQRKKQSVLQACLIPILSTVLSAPYDSSLHDIRPETITHFIIDATRLDVNAIGGDNLHNKIAVSFLQEMSNNITNKDLCKLLGKELTSLEVNVSKNEKLKREMKELTNKLLQAEFDSKTLKNMRQFNDMLDGVPIAPERNVEEIYSEDEGETYDEAPTPIDQQQESQDTNTIVENNSEHSQSDSTMADAVFQEPNPPPIAVAENNETETETAAAYTATTYGRDNTVGQRFLRRSLASSQSQSECETPDGPPPKIRIEARIDSDKKSTQPAPSRQDTCRARRYLRYAQRNRNESANSFVTEISISSQNRSTLDKTASTAGNSAEKNRSPDKGNATPSASVAKSPEKGKLAVPSSPSGNMPHSPQTGRTPIRTTSQSPQTKTTPVGNAQKSPQSNLPTSKPNTPRTAKSPDNATARSPSIAKSAEKTKTATSLREDHTPAANNNNNRRSGSSQSVALSDRIIATTPPNKTTPFRNTRNRSQGRQSTDQTNSSINKSKSAAKDSHEGSAIALRSSARLGSISAPSKENALNISSAAELNTSDCIAESPNIPSRTLRTPRNRAVGAGVTLLGQRTRSGQKKDPVQPTKQPSPAHSTSTSGASSTNRLISSSVMKMAISGGKRLHNKSPALSQTSDSSPTPVRKKTKSEQPSKLPVVMISRGIERHKTSVRNAPNQRSATLRKASTVSTISSSSAAEEPTDADIDSSTDGGRRRSARNFPVAPRVGSRSQIKAPQVATRNATSKEYATRNIMTRKRISLVRSVSSRSSSGCRSPPAAVRIVQGKGNKISRIPVRKPSATAAKSSSSEAKSASSSEDAGSLKSASGSGIVSGNGSGRMGRRLLTKMTRVNLAAHRTGIPRSVSLTRSNTPAKRKV